MRPNLIQSALIAATAGVATAAIMVPPPAASQDKREWYEKTRCVGLKDATWIACQRALKQKKRGETVAPGREWYEKTRCLNMEGAPWIACQNALKQKKREQRDRS